MNLELLKELGVKADELATGIKRVIETAYSQCGQDVKGDADLESVILSYIESQNGVVTFDTISNVYHRTSTKRLSAAIMGLVKAGRLETVFSEVNPLQVLGYKAHLAKAVAYESERHYPATQTKRIVKWFESVGRRPYAFSEIAQAAKLMASYNYTNKGLQEDLDHLVKMGWLEFTPNCRHGEGGWSLKTYDSTTKVVNKSCLSEILLGRLGDYKEPVTLPTLCLHFTSVTETELLNALNDLMRKGLVVSELVDTDNTSEGRVVAWKLADNAAVVTAPATFRTKYAAAILSTMINWHKYRNATAVAGYSDLAAGLPESTNYQDVKESILELVDKGLLEVVKDDTTQDVIGWTLRQAEQPKLQTLPELLTNSYESKPLWCQVMGRADRRPKPTNFVAQWILDELHTCEGMWLSLADIESALVRNHGNNSRPYNIRGMLDELVVQDWLEVMYDDARGTYPHAWQYKPVAGSVTPKMPTSSDWLDIQRSYPPINFDTAPDSTVNMPAGSAKPDAYVPTGRALDVYNYVKQCSTGDVVTNFATVDGIAKHFGADKSLVQSELDLLVEKGLVTSNRRADEYRIANGELTITYDESDEGKPIKLNATYSVDEAESTGFKAMHIDYIRLLRRVSEAGPFGMTDDLYGKNDESGLTFLYSHGYITKPTADSTAYIISTSGKSYIHLYDTQLNEIIEKIIVFLQSSEYGYSLGYDFHNIYNAIGVTDKVTEVREALLEASKRGVIVANANSDLYSLPTNEAVARYPIAQQPCLNVGNKNLERIHFGSYPSESADVMFNVLDVMKSIAPLLGWSSGDLTDECKERGFNYSIELVKQMLDRLVKAKYVNVKPNGEFLGHKYYVSTADSVLYCLGELNSPSIHDILEAMPDTDKEWVGMTILDLMLADKIKAKFSL